MTVVLVVLAALCSACSQGVSTTLQHRSAAAAPSGSGLRFGLLWHLGRQPMWLGGVLLGGVGFGLQAVAVGAGTLVVVQPLLVTGLLFAMVSGAVFDRRLPSRGEWVWATLLVVALAVFLLAANPAQGRQSADDGVLVPLLVRLTAAVAVAVVLARPAQPAGAASCLGVAAGIAHGPTAGLLKYTVADGRQGPAELVGHWPVWALVIVSLAATLLTQAAYQAGPLVDSLPVMTMLGTVVAVGLGALAFAESLAVSVTASTLQVGSLALMTAALVGLARRSTRQRAELHHGGGSTVQGGVAAQNKSTATEIQG